MLLHVRVRLPDRPGSLGRVTWLLGELGVDIHQVVVLGRTGGRAVDDFTIDLPGALSGNRVATALEELPGVSVEAIWPAAVPGAPWDITVLGQVAANPDRGLAILVDAAPRLFAAEWAALVTGSGDVAYTSVAAPRQVRVPQPLRARVYRTEEGHRCAVAPFGQRRPPQLCLVVARTDAPDFHTAELDRLIEVVNAAYEVVADRIDELVLPG